MESMAKRCTGVSCIKDRRTRCLCVISFGMGMSLACFCPTGLTLFLSALLLVAMGISLLRQ